MQFWKVKILLLMKILGILVFKLKYMKTESKDVLETSLGGRFSIKSLILILLSYSLLKILGYEFVFLSS